KLDLLRAELAGPNPSPVERLLVERVVACWLQVQDADVRYAQAQNDRPSRQHSDFLQRRMDRAHRRYLSALRTLALVRKLAVPVLQVNIADKQRMNVGLPVPTRRRSGREGEGIVVNTTTGCVGVRPATRLMARPLPCGGEIQRLMGIQTPSAC